MPAAGPRRRLRRLGLALRGRKARRAAQGRRPADLHGGDEPLHPLHPLRALRPGDRRRDGAGDDPPRRAFRDHHGARRHGRLRSLRQHDRPVPGRRAHQQAVPLPGPQLGAVAPQVGGPARFQRRQPDRPGQEQQGHARPAVRERGSQRMLAGRPRPLLLRSAQRRRPPQGPDDQARRRMEDGGLADGAGIHRQWPQADQGRSRRKEHRRTGEPAQHRRRAVPGRRPGARPGQREHRLSPAQRRVRQGRRRPLAGHLHRFAVQPAARAGGRLQPAQGPSAVRAARARRGPQGRGRLRHP